MRYGLLILALALAGCSTGGHWEKDAKMTDLEKDKAACRSEASQSWIDIFAAYNDCMAGKGYRKVD